jgi:UDP-glucuronate decarboxylase
LSDYNRTITQTSKKVILVTGGCGFIGSNLCERLVKDTNNFVLCLDNLSSGRISNVENLLNKENLLFIQHDITERLFLPKVDMIYHLACPASPPEYQKNPIKTIKTCIDGLWNILKLAKQNRCKMLFSSTSEIYGDPLEHPQKENYWGNVNPLGTRSCYDESKRLSETIIYEYRKKHKLDLKIVRIFNTYGPKMRLDDGRIITNIISCHLEKKTLIVNGNGNQTRSFCYIDDMLDGLIAMMDSDEPGPINLGNPDCEVTINQLIEIFNASVSKINVEYKSYDLDDPKQRRPDISLANKRLDWHPQISIQDGFLNTVYKFLHEKDGRAKK